MKYAFSYKRFLQVFFILVMLFNVAYTTETDPFVTPPILKNNVEFWKMIYTEVSLKEGLLHDSEYPLIIYRTIKIGNRSGRNKSRFIKLNKTKIENLLSDMAKKDEAQWSLEQIRISDLFNKYADKKALLTAKQRLRFQQGQKERFLEGLIRSGTWKDTIASILSKYGVPQRLQYLPHVESSFNPYAYSKVGATGLWQFMRGTGKNYGLKVGYKIDERRDPILATIAAAKLLSHNYQELKSWPIAITAYNHGLYGMKRAVKATGSRDLAVIIKRHKSRSFKFASKNFYGCFLASSEIAMNAKDYFPNIIYNPKFSCTDIKLTHYIKPSTIYKYMHVKPKIFKELNPAIRPVVFSRQQLIPINTTIHLPKRISHAEAKKYYSLIPDSLKIKNPPRPTYYRVRRGDNLNTIARKLRVSTRSIALTNGITRLNRIYAGQILRIPQRNSVVNKKINATLPTDKAPKKQIITNKKTVYKDSIDEIAMMPADTVSQTILRNNINSIFFDSDIYNMKVKQSSKSSHNYVITVSVNETIGHYADWLGIPTWRIRQLNHMGRRSTIRTGQQLLIPADSNLLQEFSQKRLEYHMGLEEDFYSQYKVSDIKTHVVKRNETLWEITANEDIIPVWLMRKYNKHINLSKLNAGMKIYIPIIEEKSAEDIKNDQSSNRSYYPYYNESFNSTKQLKPTP